MLVARDLRLEVAGAGAPDGTVETALDEHALREAVRGCATPGCEAVAVCFLYGFVRPEHEETARRIVAEEFAGRVQSAPATKWRRNSANTSG